MQSCSHTGQKGDQGEKKFLLTRNIIGNEGKTTAENI